jgi:hypothetical protein
VAALVEGGFDEIILATGIAPRTPAIPGIDNAKVLSYLDVLLERKPVGKRVAVIGAGGIGFDVSEYLVHKGVATSQDRDAFWKEWGIDGQQARGGVAGIKAEPHAPARQVYLLQRKKTKVGDGLGKTTGWIHRTGLKNKQVQMLNSVEYLSVDDAGLHIRVGDGEPQLLAVDNIVICAGQDPLRELQEGLVAAGQSVHLIGGADVAAELDAKRAINQGRGWPPSSDPWQRFAATGRSTSRSVARRTDARLRATDNSRHARILPPPSPLQRLDLPWLHHAGIEAAVLRLDLIDPLISGNKWFKLRHHLLEARQAGSPGLISLGGNHSNHLHALAAAGKRFGFATVGLLRGHEQDTPTVRDLRALGMQLHWLGFAATEPAPGGFLAALAGPLSGLALHPRRRWRPRRCPGLRADRRAVPGATGRAGLAGLRRLVAGRRYRHHPGGAGAGGAGQACGAWRPGRALDHGVPQTVAALAGTYGYTLHEASRGGFARIDDELLAFVAESEQLAGMPLEALYTGKALLALRDQVAAGRFMPGTRLVFLHSGGLQGRRGYL